MKIFRRCFYTLASMALLTACSDDPLQESGADGGGADNAVTGDGVYITINIDLPSAGGSRSVTVYDPETDNPDDYSKSDAGVEIGKDYENMISDAVLVLAESRTNNFIAAANVTTLSDISSDKSKSSYQAKSKFSKTDLNAWYSKTTDKTTYKANVYIFANPTQQIKDKLFGTTTIDPPTVGSNAWVNTICEPELDNVGLAKNFIGEISKANSFLMSNARIATREIPHSLAAWNSYSDAAHPFDLSGDNVDVDIYNEGPIYLERATARFDFRDASPLYAEDKKEENAFRYHVVYSGPRDADGNVTGDPIIDIKLSTMSLVNVDQSFYALRRVSNNGSNNSTATTANESNEPITIDNNLLICGAEKSWIETNGVYSGGNYIVDATYRWKEGAANTLNGNPNAAIEYSKHFFYPFLDDNGKIDNIGSDSRWLTKRCADVVNGTDDNTESWNNPVDGKNPYGRYKIWTYATENVIANINDQINGLSTGVVFKGKMVATSEALTSEDEDIKALAQTINNACTPRLTGDLDKDPVIYEFGGNLYLTWAKIREAAIISAGIKVTWKPNDENDASKGGEWVLNLDDIDRINNKLYVAVFGTGGFGSFEFTYYEYDEKTGEPITDKDGNKIYHTGVISDPVAADPNCANTKWLEWSNAGRPVVVAGDKPSPLMLAYKNAVTAAGITIYQSGRDATDGVGYYCYYYYWNRHNDNGQNGVMGPMEFAVVRNNVYKLAVTSIDRLGHPRLSENDPNRPTGGTKDENEDVYITVTAQVLPWVVRINNIQF